MQLLVFVTDDGTPMGTGPLLFVENNPPTSLPPNPRSLEWRYFATIAKEDTMFLSERTAGLPALAKDGFYIANRLV
jgi:hypothetical protein